MTEPVGALSGVRVLDLATLFAGPLVATLLGTYGADVTKVEHPRGDPLRTLGWSRDGVNLWWLHVNSNKRALTLDLHHETARAVLRRLVSDVDVLIENFRPGTLEAWGLGYADLRTINPRLVMVRVTGFGQSGPYRSRPGFGTIAEAVSGTTNLTGDRDGPPTLLPYAYADGIVAVTGAFAAMTALHARTLTGRGQEVDLSLYEPLSWLLGAVPTVRQQLALAPGRGEYGSPQGALRGLYRAADGRWIVFSGASAATAARLTAVLDAATGVDGGADGPPASTHERLTRWIADHPADECLRMLHANDAAAALVFSVDDLLGDPHVAARGSLLSVPHPELGDVTVVGPPFVLSDHPGRIDALGRPLGADNDDVYVQELGYGADDLRAWRAEGVI